MHRPQQPDLNCPGIIIAGLRGGSGKTIVSLGITGAWSKEKKIIAPFKKGPDYIDAGWLARSAGRSCYNLDTFLCPASIVRQSFIEHARDADIALVEGNRGLFDGIDTDGSTSTAELAKLLALPVLLVLDCTKSTRTMAALLKGCMDFDPDLVICGVILNRVAGKRHENKVRANIEKYCGIPVFGALPKLDPDDFPERHMGLLTSEEHMHSDAAIQSAIQAARDHIDLESLHEHIVRFCQAQAPVETAPFIKSPLEPEFNTLTIGVIRDSAFQFYYPDNIQALEARGAKIVYLSPLTQTRIPELDAVYMGGGFPETHASALSENHEFRARIKALSLKGLPIYAECGGLIFLGQSLCLDNVIYPMTDIFPITFGLSKKPVGHGYTKAKVVRNNPFYPKGTHIRGHEFRYSTILQLDYSDSQMAFSMERGKGIADKKDGFFINNTFGTYTHVHALGTPAWAQGFLKRAAAFKLRSLK